MSGIHDGGGEGGGEDRARVQRPIHAIRVIIGTGDAYKLDDIEDTEHYSVNAMGHRSIAIGQ